jgi:leucyl aminopeptidase (aminopeptidase T)
MAGALVIDMESYRVQRRPVLTINETADQYAKRRVTTMLKERANAGRLSWTVVSNASAEAARQVRMGKTVRVAIEDAVTWALKHERMPPPEPNSPPPSRAA